MYILLTMNMYVPTNVHMCTYMYTHPCVLVTTSILLHVCRRLLFISLCVQCLVQWSLTVRMLLADSEPSAPPMRC